MATLRKIELMYYYFGILVGGRGRTKCGMCSNFRMVNAGEKRRSKCVAYGVTSSEASDWSYRHTACGLYNQKLAHNHVPVMKRPRLKFESREDDGQLSLFEEGDAQ